MLILARHKSESIQINGGEITIVVIDIDKSRNVVRLGIEAPPNISIHRTEIQQKINKQSDNSMS